MSECVMRMNIKEMPAACGPCELSCTSICMEWTKIDRKKIGRTKSPDCPIIAILPEGHGRLIDADALHKIAWPVKDHTGRIEECVQMRDLYKAPTIVPAEEERSKP